MTAVELFADPPVPGSAAPWSFASLAAPVNTTPAPGTVETWTLGASPPDSLTSSGSGRFRFVVDNEVCIDVTGGPGTARQVWRGAEGSTPATHANASQLYHSISAQSLSPLGQVFYATQYGVQADGRTVTDAAINAGQNTLSSTQAGFTSPRDVNKLAVVLGAGSPVSTTSTAALTSGAGVTALAVNALGADMPPGGVVVSSGANSQQFVTSGAKSGATSIPLIGQVVGGLTSALSTGAAITSLPVAALQFALASGSVTLIAFDATGVLQTQTFSTTGAAVGATSIPVTSQTPNYAYPESAIVFGAPVSVNANFSYPIGSAVRTNTPALFTTIASVTAGVATLAANAGTTVTGAECFFASDDYSALNRCLSDAGAAGGTMVVPLGDMGLSQSLATSNPITIQGHGVTELYGGTSAYNSANFPTIVPYLQGSVLVMCAANRDIVQYTAQGRSQAMKWMGLRFAGRYQNTGHGLNNVSGAGLGNIGGVLDDVRVFGVDGNHYGLVCDSPELMRWSSFRSYGGGGVWFKTNALCPGPPGNNTSVDLNIATYIAGCAQGLLLDASGQAALGFDSSAFVNPEMGVRVPSPALANTTPPPNGGAQNPLTTFNAGYMTIFTMVCPGAESDPSGSVCSWPTGYACSRTNDFNAAFAKSSQDGPSVSPSSGVGYQNRTGKFLEAISSFTLFPAAAATASTTLSAQANAGATAITVTSAAGFSAGVGIQIDTGLNMEFAIVASVSGTTINLVESAGWGLSLTHASGVNVSVGAAVVVGQNSSTGTFPGSQKLTWEGAPVGAGARTFTCRVPIPCGWYYRLDWANATRMWSENSGTYG